MKKAELFILTSFILLSVIATFVNIGVGTLFTTSGFQYSQIEDKTKTLATENTILKEKILKDESFFTIASEAASLGFEYTKSNQSIILSEPLPIAYRQ